MADVFLREPRSRTDRLTPLAIAFALGIAMGRHQPEPMLWPWFALTISCALAAAQRRVRELVPPIWPAAVAMVALGAVWFTLTNEHAARNDLAVMLGDEPRVITVTGVAQAGPTLHRQVRGSLAQFGYRGPSAYFPARVDGLRDSSGEFAPARGRLLINIDEPLPPFRAGDRFEATGHFNPFKEPRNHGEINRRELAKGLGQAGSLHLPRRELLRVTPADHFSPYTRFLGFRENLQNRAGAYLFTDLPDARTADRDALLKALLLGQREPDLHHLNDAFRRLGISHFLAISGLHLGILAAMFLLALRMMSGQRRWHAWLAIFMVLGYLLLVEVRVPVLRAGIMTIAATLGLALSRRLNAAGLVALSGILILLWQPHQLLQPGFQLSFAVVIGLLRLAPLLRGRWFGYPDYEATTAFKMLIEWGKNAFAVAVTAWLIATPIIAYHFGIISPAGIPLAVVGVPIVAILLALGYAKMLLALLLPSIAMILGAFLSVTAEVAIAVIVAIDAMPGIAWHVPFPHAAWTLAALAFVWILIERPHWVSRWSATAGFVALALALWWPIILPPTYALRIDMISVGHGTCFIVRSGDGETLVFDAGSNTRLDSGERWIIPAMRRLNIRRVDTIAISHPHFDHYSAVIELVDEFAPQRIYVTHQFIEHGRENPETAVSHVADVLTNAYRNAPRPIYAGESRSLGQARLTWLHPPKNLAEFGRDNEHSMVVRIDVSGRIILLTGDVERAGLAGLMARNPDLRVDILEMPHHGAWHELTAELLRLTRPGLVLQSSGRSQWSRDRWQELLEEIGADRLVTHRDGASWIEIGRDGEIQYGAFRRR